MHVRQRRDCLTQRVRGAADARSGGYAPPPRRAVGANGAVQAKGRPSPFAREQGKGGHAGLASRPQARRSLSQTAMLG